MARAQKLAGLPLNKGFDQGTSRETHTGQAFGEIEVPRGWVAWWEEGDYKRPEMKVIPRQEPYLDPPRVRQGEKALLYFTKFGRQHAGLYQEIHGLEPGRKYEFGAYAHAWSQHPSGDPHCSSGVGCDGVYIPEGEIPEPTGEGDNDAVGNFVFRVGVQFDGEPDPFSDQVFWGAGAAIYNEYHQVPGMTFTAPDDGRVVVYLRSRSRYPFECSDAYWDETYLRLLPDDDDYYSLVNVLHRDVPTDRAVRIFEERYGQARETVISSHDDAIKIMPDRVVLWDIPVERREAYREYYRDRGYDGELVVKLLDEEPDYPSYTQGDEPWGGDRLGTPACPLTVGQAGCYITCLSYARRLYGLNKESTPRTVNEALQDAEGYLDCLPRWSSIEEVLDLSVEAVWQGAGYAQTLLEHLESGGYGMIEVQPSALQHFVLAVEHDEERGFLVIDPIQGDAVYLDERYAGIESVRLLTVAQDEIKPPQEEPPEPANVNLIGLHQQTGWDLAREFLATVRPRATKVFEMEKSEMVKAASPDTAVVLRYFTSNQPINNCDLKQAAYDYVATFADGLVRYEDTVDYVESWNETYPGRNGDVIQRAAEFDAWFAEALSETGLDVAPCLGNAAVGCVHENKVPLLLPMYEAVGKYNGLVGYHGYWWAMPDKEGLLSWWEYHAGRALELWDPYFVEEHGIRARYFATETGGVATSDGGYNLNAGGGWRSHLCYAGDVERYVDAWMRYEALHERWNEDHNDRSLGGAGFTTGIGIGWDTFQKRDEWMQAVMGRL